jgi:hypothetical protein
MDHSQFVREPGEKVQLEQLDPSTSGEFGSEEAAKQLRSLHSEYPRPDPEQSEQLARAREILEQ